MSFNIAKYRTFAAFQKAGASYYADYVERGAQVSKLFLSAAVLNAMRSPGAAVQAIADGALEGLSINPETVKNYRSQMVKAISFARTKAIIPTFGPSMGEADVIALVAAFCDKYTLRGLYDEARKPAQAKAEERKVERGAKAEAAETEARQAAGVEGETALSVAKLFAAVAPWQEAAAAGDVNAERVLAALEAALYEARMAKAAQAEQAKLAA